MVFGEFIKEKRLAINLSLRKFCEMARLDASNWSKIERNMLPLSYENDKLVEICHILKIQDGTPDWTKFFDLAAVSKGKIPEYVYSDQNVLEALPIFFRTASKEKPSEEELNKLIELIKHR